jgi:hypothetical protein
MTAMLPFGTVDGRNLEREASCFHGFAYTRNRKHYCFDLPSPGKV